MTQKAPLPDRVTRTILQYGMLEAGERVLVGVSGGADSVCLLRTLAEHSADLSIGVGVAHVNHGWRSEDAAGDALFVRDLTTRLGLEFFLHEVPSAAVKQPTESGARKERHRFFKALCHSEGFQKIALAHTLDDRNETFFLNLMRGSGTRGLSTMRPRNGLIIRPLIETARSELEEYLREVGQSWRVDVTNLDPRYARNRVRRNIFPLLRSEFNPQLDETLARTVDLLEAEDSWMDQLVQTWLEPRLRRDAGDLVLDINDLASQPVALVRRALRQALTLAGSSMTDIGYDHLERVRSLLTRPSGRTIELPGSISVERSFQSLRFFPAEAKVPDYEYELPIPGEIEVPEAESIFAARLVEDGDSKPDKPNANRVFVNGDSLGRYVKIRNWKSGDKYEPQGLSGSKLKTLFQRERIPRRQRRQWPVLVTRSSIVWVASFPVSRDFVPRDGSRRIVVFETSPIDR